MTILATPSITDGCLTVRGKVILTGVPDNIVCFPASGGSVFIGASSTNSSSRHVFTLGVLEGYRFLCIFRFKIWWMIPSFGKSGSQVPIETQMLLLECNEKTVLQSEVAEPSPAGTFYILFLPALEGKFRTSLQGSSDNEVQLCVESGDPCVQTCEVKEALFINSGVNPFELMKISIKTLAKHKETFSHVDDKKIPKHIDWFGWCTWDAFYAHVNPKGIQEGLQSLSGGGCPPKFLIIDDGWQDTYNDFLKEGETPTDGLEFAARLIDVKENKMFQQWDPNNTCSGLPEFIKTVREKHGLRFSAGYIYMWHAVVGYWGGIHPEWEAMKKYNPKLLYPVLSPGNKSHVRCGAMESLVRDGVGLIDPSKIYDFYNDVHSYLASCGVDGVKVDIQNVIEALGNGYGGRVTLTKQYQQALEESVSKNFKENNLICSMCQSNDCFYSSKNSPIARVSEDFMPHVPCIQTSHVAAVAFNSLFQGEISAVDWDMFQSAHTTADFHGAARALGGCAVYVSDKPGKHAFKILKKLVLPDGSILRARYAGRPTRDCLFNDPVGDGKSLLKIWNMNKVSGIIGVFNCQGAGRWNLGVDVSDFKRDTEHIMQLSEMEPLSCLVSPTDVDLLEDIAGENWNGKYAAYTFNSGVLRALSEKESLKISLGVLKYEIFTVTPIRVIGQRIHFAPIGLLDMYNSGGSLESLRYSTSTLGCAVKIIARGCGRFGTYSNLKPKYCRVEMKDKAFIYDSDTGLLTFMLDDDCHLKEIEILY